MSFNGIFKNRYLLVFNKRYSLFDHVYLSHITNRSITTLSAQELHAKTLYRRTLEKDACGVGMIANLNNDFNRNTITSANEMLVNMAHRGGEGVDKKCGDGAGILTTIPHKFLQKSIQQKLPDIFHYGTGNVFFGKDTSLNRQIKDIFQNIIENDFGFKLLCWRSIPTNNTNLGTQSLETEPLMEQIFITQNNDNHMLPNALFERQLLLLRNVLLNRIEKELCLSDYFYICSLSNKTITYKGQLSPPQLFDYFRDLQDADFVSNFALVHSRFSTNTFPSWSRAQPNRITCHNGEINTLRGNKNWMHSRSGLAQSKYFGARTSEIFPICSDNMTDSGNFDSVLETLCKGTDDTLPQVVASMVPEAWQNDANMSVAKRQMYEYLSCKMEPWDGPALIAFCDGNYAGAVLDRNGLRPSRYYITNEKQIIFASEVGVLPNIDQSIIMEKGRLEPGKMFLIDLQNNRIIRDKEFKDKIARSHPYDEWLSRNLISLSDLNVCCDGPVSKEFAINNECELHEFNAKLNLFGYTNEILELVILPMFLTGKESLGSMGNDASLAVLSTKPKLLFEYFKQLFAQVTNPPIDPIRERFVMTLKCPVGPELNLFATSEQHCGRLILEKPILRQAEMDKIRNNDNPAWNSIILDCTFAAHSGKQAMLDRLSELCAAAENAIISNKVAIIVLSDAEASSQQCPLPSLMVLGAVHHHLINKQLRSNVALFFESGECAQVHDFCTLLGYGADGIYPYMAYNIMQKLQYENNIEIRDLDKGAAVENYITAVSNGILKVMSKMGISTLQSYKGAQVFEAIGLNEDIIATSFAGTHSRIGGTNFDVLYTDIMRLYEYGYGRSGLHQVDSLRTAGDYHFRTKQEEHFNTPETISCLQSAVRHNSQEAYDEYSQLSDVQCSKVTLRGLLKFNHDAVARTLSIDEVEPVSEILRRFNTGAMSLGSISRETHETLAQAMNAIGGRSNTGEGGEDISRFNTDKRSAIKQIASGRFGVTINYLCNSDQIQIKMAQGAKPGEGGELPGYKVSDYIGRIRHTLAGVGLISPPPHHDIYSIEDLSQLIFDLKQCNPRAEISVKLVSEVGVGIVAAGVAKAKANHITISGHDGGTGASAWTGIKNGGAPWELGLAEVQHTLVLNGWRDRVKIQTDGQLKTGRDVVIATLLGAEEYAFATAPLIALGCIMMRKCHLNTCPVGIATQDEELRKKFEGQPEHVINYFYFVAQEVRAYMASLGFASMEQMVGQTQFLAVDDAKLNYKTKFIDLNALLVNANHVRDASKSVKLEKESNGVDDKLIELCAASMENCEQKTNIKYPYGELSSKNRTVGARLSYEISKKYGEYGLQNDDVVSFEFDGCGGQSFACGLAKGVTLKLRGDSNDYVGKLLSGGIIAISPPENVGFHIENAHKHIIVGNACLYGATSGKAFFNGKSGERFAVRNSGAICVVEGCGNHGCEYMTGGRVVILGAIGKNCFAGMSGGIAYIYNLEEQIDYINKEMVIVQETEEEDLIFLENIIEQHLQYTKSYQAKCILNDWDRYKKMFTKIMPRDYKRVLSQKQQTK